MQMNGGPDFSAPVTNDGYAWWYVDALSDDGRHGLTVIAFVGSVFSPYYARARRAGPADPQNYCAINVALYGASGKRWALTERGRGDLHRTVSDLVVGPSSVRWDGTDLVITIDEMTVPIPSRLRGTIRLSPSATVENAFTLNTNGNHRWRPIAPFARVALDFQRPALRWTGHGYFDCNAGDAPLETGFVDWDWSRATSAKETHVLYDGQCRDGDPFSLAIAIDQAGRTREFAPPPRAKMPPTPVWRIPRETRSDPATAPRVTVTCEDTPFYARSMMTTSIEGNILPAMHESLLLDRFAARWVQTLLHFRMPRIAK